MIRLETPRLILRDHEPADLEAFCAIESDPEYRWPQAVHPRAELERSFGEAWLRPKTLGLWATEYRATREYVGRCGLYPHRTEAGVIVPGELTLGFYLSREVWGRGLATEAGRALIELAFGSLGARRVHAGVHRENLRSRRVVEKLWFSVVRLVSPDGSPAVDFALDNPTQVGAAKGDALAGTTSIANDPGDLEPMRSEQNEEERNVNRTNNHDGRIARMTFASVYPHYLAKVEKKGRTKEELHQVISWLTGFDEKTLQKQIKDKVTFEQFFQRAKLNPNAHRITGVICGYRVEEIENPLTQQARYLDKLVDELAKGRKMERILRAE